MAKREGLRPQQRRLCLEYLKDFNQKQAAIRAGYSPKTAAAQACMILQRPEVKAFLNAQIERQEFKCEVDARRVITELARIAFYDIGTFYKRSEDGKELILKDLDELTPDQRACIQDYDPKTKAIKLLPKDPALDKLGKHLKLFTDIDPQVSTNFVLMPVVKLGGKELEFNVGKPAPKQIQGVAIPVD